ncbi:DMT family transporter [Inediibacterium massiliense]|uniref:DMT family transporter n=1 Tax=Inediibacterium massiliense TaxID=1658111 RepID=UPI0006B44BF3|nr:DMT family transporter [Inediibacterium massiliense]
MSTKKVYSLLIVAVIFWGTSFATAKVGMGDLAPAHFLFLRIFFAAIAFFFILRRMEPEKRKLHKEDFPYMMYLGFMGFIGYFIVQYTALHFTSTVNASLIVGIAPIIIAVYGTIFLKEELNIYRILGMMLCFIGILAIITKGQLGGLFKSKTLFGDFLMILDAGMMAAFSIGSKSILEKYDPFIAIAHINTASLVLLIPIILIPNSLSPVSFIYVISKLSIKNILGALYLAITCTVIGYYGWYIGIKEIGASRTAVFNYINPLVTSIVSMVMFQEDLSIFTLLGGIGIIIGVSLNNMKISLGKRSGRAS